VRTAVPEESPQEPEMETANVPSSVEEDTVGIVTEIEINFDDGKPPVKVLPLWEMPGMKVMSIMALPFDKRGVHILELLTQALATEADRERLRELSFGQLNKSIQDWLEKSSDVEDEDE
jgi:hypothetical protein